MNVLDNLNNRIRFYENNYNINEKKQEEYYSPVTDKEIKLLEEYAGFKLPNDYITFLKETNFKKKEAGIALSFISNSGSQIIVALWNIKEIMEQRNWYPFLEEYKGDMLIIGDDLGDSFFMYQNGQNGFGIYVEDAGACVPLGNAAKLSNTLTELLVEGKGLDNEFFL